TGKIRSNQLLPIAYPTVMRYGCISSTIDETGPCRTDRPYDSHSCTVHYTGFSSGRCAIPRYGSQRFTKPFISNGPAIGFRRAPSGSVGTHPSAIERVSYRRTRSPAWRPTIGTVPAHVISCIPDSADGFVLFFGAAICSGSTHYHRVSCDEPSPHGL